MTRRSADTAPAASRVEPDRLPASAIADTILDLLARRQNGATICPSEVARALTGGGGPWRELMPQVRQVAQGLTAQGRLRVTRGGVPVDATSRGGPIRLGRTDPPDGG